MIGEIAWTSVAEANWFLETGIKVQSYCASNSRVIRDVAVRGGCHSFFFVPNCK